MQQLPDFLALVLAVPAVVANAEGLEGRADGMRGSEAEAVRELLPFIAWSEVTLLAESVGPHHAEVELFQYRKHG